MLFKNFPSPRYVCPGEISVLTFELKLVVCRKSVAIRVGTQPTCCPQNMTMPTTLTNEADKAEIKVKAAFSG